MKKRKSKMENRRKRPTKEDLEMSTTAPLEITRDAELGRQLSGYATLQELVDKSFQIKQSSQTSSWH
jgi:hypothetical protein